jgi:PadR family transcriptional regulator AphA
MSLRHGILGVVSAKPMTGYDLVQYFDTSVGFFWPAKQPQIYPELHRMEKAGLLSGRVTQGLRGEKRLYAITAKGEAELRRWVSEAEPYSADKDATRLKTMYLDEGDFETARAHFKAHIAHYAKRVDRWQERIDRLHNRESPLLGARLKKRPPEEHEAIIAYKVLAFQGQIARAQVEMSWAESGLVLVTRLEQLRNAKPAKRSLARAMDGRATPQVSRPRVNRSRSPRTELS